MTTTAAFRETDHPRSTDGTFTTKAAVEAEIDLEQVPAPVLAALQPGESQWGWPAVEDTTGLDAVEVSRSAETGRYEIRGERHFRYTDLVPETVAEYGTGDEWARRHEPVIDEVIAERYAGAQVDSRCGEAVAAFHCDFESVPSEDEVAGALNATGAPTLSRALRHGTVESRALRRGIIEKISATAMVDDAQAARRAAKAIREAGMVDAVVTTSISDAHAMAVAAEAGCSADGSAYPQLCRFASRGLGDRASMAAELDAAEGTSVSPVAAAAMRRWLAGNGASRPQVP